MKDENLIIDHYKIIDEIGKGNKGTVYKVRDLFTSKILALKILFSEIKNVLNKNYIEEQFFKLVNFEHKNLIKIYDFGLTTDKKYYFIMEYIEGKNLKAFKINNEETLYQVIYQICHALDYLHFNDFIHFNIKPSNIVLVEKDDDIEVKLLDFGFSQYNIINKKDISKSINYIAPEIIKVKKIDKKVDFYSLGAVLYELLTGSLPFSDDKLQDLINNYLEKPPSPLREINLDISLEIEKMVLKLLSKNPNNRYDNALDIIKEINIIIKRTSYYDKNNNKVEISNPFVGRKNELNILKQLLIKNTHKEGNLVLIKGESGVGKSYLLQRFKLFCQLEHSLFIVGQCDDSSNVSYKPIIEILQKLIQILRNKQRKDIIVKFKSSLLKLLPELADNKHCKDLTKKTSEIQLPKEGEKTRLIEEIFRFLIEARKVTPYAIAIEDFHLAGNEIIEMIQYFSVNSPFLIFVSCKSEAINNNERLKRLIRDFQQEDSYKEIILKRLDFDEVKLMLSLVLHSYLMGGKLIEKIYKNTLGNPFFVKEEIISLIDEGILYQDNEALTLNEDTYKKIMLSSNLKELIKNHIGKLNNRTFEVLEIFSIVETKFKNDLTELICKILDLTLKDIQEILYNLVSHNIIIDNKNFCSFYHPKMKEVVKSQIISERKKLLHQKIGTVLEQIYEKQEIINNKVEELAYHFVNGTNKKKALSYSLKACEITEKSYAYQITIKHYKNILLIKNLDEIKKKLASVYEIVGKYDESINCWEELLENSSEKEKINIYRRMARLYRVKGNYQKALVCLNKGKKESLDIKPLPQLELTKLYIEWGWYYYRQGKLKEARLECESALKTLKEKDKDLLSEIYNLLGSILFGSSDYDQSIMHYEKSLEISVKTKNMRGIIRAYHNIGTVYVETRRVDKAIYYYNECLKSKIKVDIYLLEHVYSNLGYAYIIKEDYDLANFYILKAMQIAKRIGYYIGIIVTYENLGQLYHKKEMNEIALNYLGKALKLSHYIGSELFLLDIYYQIANVYLDLNEIDKSFKYCQKALELTKNSEISNRKVGKIYRVLALIYDKKQDNQKAVECFRKSEELLKKSGYNFDLAETYYCNSSFHKNKLESSLEKAMEIYKNLDLLNDYEKAKKELKWIREEKTENIKKYKVLYEITQIITSILSLNQLFPIIVNKIIEITNAEKGYLLLLNAEGELDVKVAHKSNKKQIEKPLKEIEWSIIKKALKLKKTILNRINLNGNNSKAAKNIVMCTPLQTKNKLVGLIYVESKVKEKIFSENDLEFFEIYAKQIAISIENAMLYENASEFKTINQLKITPLNVKKAPEEINNFISTGQKIFKENMTDTGFGNIIGKNPKMMEVYNLISKVAVYDTNVLILGESGTGKELVSEEIHKLSKRHKGKLVKINVANLNENLLESEIFGYEKGAFTGAYKSKKGKLEIADKGTLFLDEIEEIPLNLQAKLLRVLETKTFYKVGGTSLIHSDFRLICATNVELKNLVGKGKFREDLYYRIYKFMINIPPLREKKDDIFLIFKHFIENNSIAKKKAIKYISESAWQIIEEYDYPGNVRELLSILENAIIICEGEQIRLEHLPKHLTEQIKTKIEKKYQKILGEKELTEKHSIENTHNNESQQVMKKSVETHNNESLQFNNLHFLQKTMSQMDILLSVLIKKRINLKEKGCVKKLYQEIEKVIILYLLEKLNGNALRLSQMLDINYSTLKRKLKDINDLVKPKYEMSKEDSLFKELIKVIKTTINNSIVNNEKKINLIRNIEKKFIEITLKETKWTKKDVCTLLEINHRTLNKNLVKYQITKP